MCNMLDSFKQDLNSSLPRQVRAVVQQIHREAQGKQLEGSPNMFNLGGGGVIKLGESGHPCQR
jgi:hypothetical protein